jgi:hypothetical protein
MDDLFKQINDFFEMPIEPEKVEEIISKPLTISMPIEQHSICTAFGCQMRAYLEEIIKLKTTVIKLEVLCQILLSSQMHGGESFLTIAELMERWQKEYLLKLNFEDKNGKI